MIRYGPVVVPRHNRGPDPAWRSSSSRVSPRDSEGSDRPLRPASVASSGVMCTNRSTHRVGPHGDRVLTGDVGPPARRLGGGVLESAEEPQEPALVGAQRSARPHGQAGPHEGSQPPCLGPPVAGKRGGGGGDGGHHQGPGPPSGRRHPRRGSRVESGWPGGRRRAGRAAGPSPPDRRAPVPASRPGRHSHPSSPSCPHGHPREVAMIFARAPVIGWLGSVPGGLRAPQGRRR